MAIAPNITPSEFIYNYLTVSESQFGFVQYNHAVYLIDYYLLEDYEGEDCVLDKYNASTFHAEFAGSAGFRYCCCDLQDYIEGHLDRNNSLASETINWFTDHYHAEFPQDTTGIGRLFMQDFGQWYYNFKPYNWFNSEMFKTVCEAMRGNIVFAPENVPMVTTDDEDLLIAMESVDY